jgi:hypothetical protein
LVKRGHKSAVFSLKYFPRPCICRAENAVEGQTHDTVTYWVEASERKGDKRVEVRIIERKETYL